MGSAGWRDIGGVRKYYRSKWEANYARFLESQKNNGDIKNWSHESHTFWFYNIKRGVRSYLPDFEVELNDGTNEYREVKGYYTRRTITIFRRMKKYYPNTTVKIIDGEWFKNNKNLKFFISGWE